MHPKPQWPQAIPGLLPSPLAIRLREELGILDSPCLYLNRGWTRLMGGSYGGGGHIAPPLYVLTLPCSRSSSFHTLFSWFRFCGFQNDVLKTKIGLLSRQKVVNHILTKFYQAWFLVGSWWTHPLDKQ
jgi:hypothetical protein